MIGMILLQEDEVSIVKFSSSNDSKISNIVADVVDKHHVFAAISLLSITWIFLVAQRGQELNPSRAEEAMYLQAVLTRNFKVLYQVHNSVPLAPTVLQTSSQDLSLLQQAQAHETHHRR